MSTEPIPDAAGGTADTVRWLLTAATRLESEGQHNLAAEARAEADALCAPKLAPIPVAIRCDNCRRIVSDRQAEKYSDILYVDWALCTRCE
jgi:hypothetical protein